MLEAIFTDLVFTISLKRSTQNLQLSTSWPADYPIFAPKATLSHPDAARRYGRQGDMRWSKRRTHAGIGYGFATTKFFMPAALKVGSCLPLERSLTSSDTKMYKAPILIAPFFVKSAPPFSPSASA